MVGMPRFMGLREFVEELSETLTAAQLQSRYSHKEALVADVLRAVEGFLEWRLAGELKLPYKLWRGLAEAGSAGIEPSPLFGTHFAPDALIEVSQKPTLAISVHWLPRGRGAPTALSAALGEALVLSRLYPAVLTLLCRSRREVPYRHLLDREITMELWNTYRIKLLFR